MVVVVGERGGEGALVLVRVMAANVVVIVGSVLGSVVEVILLVSFAAFSPLLGFKSKAIVIVAPNTNATAVPIAR